VRRPVGCTIGVRPEAAQRAQQPAPRSAIPQSPGRKRKSVYDKTGARHRATQEPRAAARGAARGAAGAPPGHARAPLSSRARVPRGVRPRGDGVISARASATPRDSFCPRYRAGGARGRRALRLGSPRAARGGTRRESSAAATGSPATSWLPRPEPLPAPSSPPPDWRAVGRIGGGRRSRRGAGRRGKRLGRLGGACVASCARHLARSFAAFVEPQRTPWVSSLSRSYPRRIPAGDDVSSHPGATRAARGRDVRGALSVWAEPLLEDAPGMRRLDAMDASPPSSPPVPCDAKFPTNIVPAGSGDTLVEGIGGVDAAREEGR